MTVTSETSELPFTGDGGNISFPVSFPIQQPADLVVTLKLLGGAPVLQVLGTHYGVSPQGPTATPYDSSNVIFGVAPAVGATVDISRTVPITQEKSLRTSGIFDAKTHENALDKLTYIAQELARRIASLEALGSLASLATLNVALVNVTFNTDANVIENTFAGGVVTVPIPAGFTIRGVLVAKVVGGAGGKEAVQVRDWTLGDNLILGFVSGLDLATSYTLTLLLLSLPVT